MKRKKASLHCSLLFLTAFTLLRDPSDELSESTPQEIVDSDTVGCGVPNPTCRPPSVRLPSAGKTCRLGRILGNNGKQIVSNLQIDNEIVCDLGNYFSFRTRSREH